MNSPLISVIIPCYNYGHFLSDALSAVKSQTFNDWECIVVNNASTDNTEEIVKQFASEDTRFKYICLLEKGVSKARNIGIQNAIGEFILPLDADDKIGNQYLGKALKILAGNKKIKIVYCRAELFGEMNGKWDLPQFSWKDFLFENMIFASCLFRKIDWERAGGYDEFFNDGLEDWDFIIRLLKNGGEVYCIPDVLFYYRIHSSSRNSIVVKDLALQKNIRESIFKKHKTLYEDHFDLKDLLWENLQLRNKINEISLELNRLKSSRAFKIIKKIF
jgi:glycosyltransferase involved in cell wall biosynthesis